MQAQSFKIIPLLVFVSLLAFSVRLADVVMGFSSLSGSAYAESASKEPAADVTGQNVSETSPEAGEAAETKAEPAEKAAEPGAVPDPVSKEPAKPVVSEEEGAENLWKDASDEDPSYDSARMELFEDLAKRRKELDEREAQMMTREALLQAAEKELDRKYQELSQLRQKIEGLLEEQSEEEQTRLKSLVKIYEGMKPKDAARIFDTLDLDVLVAVMGLMSERRLSPILAEMNPERARTITIMLAEQKQLPSLPPAN